MDENHHPSLGQVSTLKRENHFLHLNLTLQYCDRLHVTKKQGIFCKRNNSKSIWSNSISRIFRKLKTQYLSLVFWQLTNVLDIQNEAARETPNQYYTVNAKDYKKFVCCA